MSKYNTHEFVLKRNIYNILNKYLCMLKLNQLDDKSQKAIIKKLQSGNTIIKGLPTKSNFKVPVSITVIRKKTKLKPELTLYFKVSEFNFNKL